MQPESPTGAGCTRERGQQPAAANGAQLRRHPPARRARRARAPRLPCPPPSTVYHSETEFKTKAVASSGTRSLCALRGQALIPGGPGCTEKVLSRDRHCYVRDCHRDLFL